MKKLNAEQAQLLFMSKEATFGHRGNQLVAALAALSALTSITWATTSLADRAARQKWQKKLEAKLQSQGVVVDKAFLANLQPTISLQEEMPKLSSLQVKLLYKEAGIGRNIAHGLGSALTYLGKNPYAGSAALGGGVGYLAGGDLKSALMGAGGGLAARRFLNFDPSMVWRTLRERGINTRDWWRAQAQAAQGR